MKARPFLFFIFFLFIKDTGLAQTNDRGVIVKSKSDTGVIKGDTYAIIVGISDYKLIPHLQFAHKDAQAFESFLLSDAGGKIPRPNIETFLNENATRSNVGDAISVIARKAKPGDRVYFFFAGHGDMEDLTQVENGLLLLYNSPNGNYFGMNDDVLEILDLKRYLSPLAQRGVEMIFIVDACHSGNLKGGVEGEQQTATALANSWGKEYKILSCQPNQLSLESTEWGGGRGLFSLMLEEGMKGLADKNNDGKVSFAELQRYLTDKVDSFSEDKQTPLVSGDLSKTFSTVNPVILNALKKQKAQNYPILAVANSKGNENRYIDSLDPEGKRLYLSFTNDLEHKRLIWPRDTNALRDYRAFVNKEKDNPLIAGMRRTLAASLNERFNGIVAPLLNDQTSYSSRDECYYAAAELDSCLHLLGEHHYMYSNLKARKLFMDAMALTWALNDNEYNISWKATVLESIKLLEQSAKLEPNAAYTLSALGIRYNFIFEYDKANKAFQRYIDLRPHDHYAKISLGLIYDKLGQLDKSEAIFESLLQEDPDNLDLQLALSDVYWMNNKTDRSLALIDRIIGTEKGKMWGYFSKGVYYSRANKSDSAIYYYNLSRKYDTAYCSLCDNNIGNIYFVNNQSDSAKKYFLRILSKDSTYAFAHFNLGTMLEKEGDHETAMKEFYATIRFATTSLEGFITHMQLYFGKTYDTSNAKAYQQFIRKSYTVNMHYVAYLSMLYTYIRIPGLIVNTKNINFLFEQLFNFKQFDRFTWYQHACYLALKGDKAAALENLEKALQMGFGDRFMFSNDHDLDLIRNMAEYTKLKEKYFPDEPGKMKQ